MDSCELFYLVRIHCFESDYVRECFNWICIEMNVIVFNRKSFQVLKLVQGYILHIWLVWIHSSSMIIGYVILFGDIFKVSEKGTQVGIL